MTRATLTTALLTALVCTTSLACSSEPGAPSQAQAQQAQAEQAQQAQQAQAEQAAADELAGPIAAPIEPAATPELPAPVIDEPVLASTTVAPRVAPRVARPAVPVALRSPSLVPAGTPDEHLAAFTHLRVGKHDKPLVGGVGASGIHLDELEVGKGWAASRCTDLGARFEAETDDRVNVCFRAVHPRFDETVTVEWARNGKTRSTIAVNIRPTHAYLSRAWLPVGAGRAGEWTATIKSEDGSVLGQLEFEIVK